ncbi:MAG: HNH endonuclease [Bacteroidales bacterium]|nr:HNH endonuclease [Bacteroidales bacterium]
MNLGPKTKSRVNAGSKNKPNNIQTTFKQRGGGQGLVTTEFKFCINKDGCFICKGRFLNKDGYPQCKLNGKTASAARYIYSKVHGGIPKGMVVRHKCDNPRCINPLHLELGTQGDNNRDRNERDRTARGTRGGRTKLTVSQVKEIKAHAEKPASYFADLYGVCRSTVRQITINKTWRHIKLDAQI